MCKLSLNQNLTQILNPEYVEVLSDGIKTGHTIFAELYSLIDIDKITPHSYFEMLLPNGEKQVARYVETTNNGGLIFSWSMILKINSVRGLYTNTYVLSSTPVQYTQTTTSSGTTNGESSSSDVPSAGRRYRVYYK